MLVASPETPDGGAPEAGLTFDAGTPDAGRGPPWPIVLAHGFFGFDTFAGLDCFTYYFGVKDTLASEGELLVFTPAVDPFNDSATRSAQLERQIEDILATTGAAKVNVIAHSQGGLDARMVASRRPELVAAVITVSTPHRGTPVSDLVSLGLQDPRARAAVDAIVGIAAPPIWSDASRRSSITAALAQFETSRMTDFNARYPDPPGVRYFSVAGRSALRRASDHCETADANRPPFIKAFDDTVDGGHRDHHQPQPLRPGGQRRPGPGGVGEVGHLPGLRAGGSPRRDRADRRAAAGPGQRLAAPAVLPLAGQLPPRARLLRLASSPLRS